MSLSPSSEKKTKLCSEKEIGDLADADLAAIFERLPPYDRLIASEVCRRWHGLSRKAWLDVKHLDLTPFSEHYMGATAIRLCPNLQTVVACKKSLDLNELVRLTRSSNLLCVKLYDCNFALPDNMPASFSKTFAESLEQTSWSEFIFHDAYLVPEWFFSHACLPPSLTRLQLSSLRLEKKSFPWASLMLDTLDRLRNLECLILAGTPDFGVHDDDLACCTMLFGNRYFPKRICAMKNLKELCIGPALALMWPDLTRIMTSLPKLEVLFISDLHGYISKFSLRELLTTNSVLRILVLFGKIDRPPTRWCSQDLPTRKRSPPGPPLPLLHIFVCREAAQNFCFDTSSSSQAIVYPINEPMPQFLERADIAPIFDGVWVAERIKDAAKNGGELWNYEVDDTASYALINGNFMG